MGEYKHAIRSKALKMDSKISELRSLRKFAKGNNKIRIENELQDISKEVINLLFPRGGNENNGV